MRQVQLPNEETVRRRLHRDKHDHLDERNVSGRGGGIRTPDNEHPKLVHYQAVRLPETGFTRSRVTLGAHPNRSLGDAQESFYVNLLQILR